MHSKSFSKGFEAYNLIPSSISSAEAVSSPAVKTARQPSASNHAQVVPKSWNNYHS